MIKQNHILSLLILCLIFSCGQNSSEKRLNGKWYEIKNEYNIWHFFPDSLVFPNLGEKHEWEASNSKIKFDLITYIWDSHEKRIDYQDKIVIDYKINNDNDSLFGTLKNKYGKHKFSLIKAENYLQFLHKKFDIEFELPKDSLAEEINPSIRHNNNRFRTEKYGLKIFLAYSGNKIVGKTELSENLENLKLDIIRFKDSLKPNKNVDLFFNDMLEYKFHLRIFADKKIRDSTITKLLKITIKSDVLKLDKNFFKPPNDILPIRIYRIYESDEQLNPWNTKGKEIKTNAETIFY